MFEHLDRVTDELRRDRSRTKLAQAVTMYHVIVEATLAQPGQHFIEDYLDASASCCPASAPGCTTCRWTSSATSASASSCCATSRAEDPEVPEAVADLLREVLPFTLGVFVPPGWDRRYTECFGFTLEEIYEEGARSFEAKLRAAGLPLETLPGPLAVPDRPAAARARASAAWRCCRRGILGEKNGAAGARPGDDGAAVRHRAPRRRPPHRARRARSTRAVGLPRRRAVAPAARQRLDRGGAGAGRSAGHRVPRRYEDWVDVVGGRLDPRRAMATGRLRPRGSLRALWSARGIFGA